MKENKYKWFWFHNDGANVDTADSLEEIIEEIINTPKHADIENLEIKTNGESIDITYFDTYEDSDKEFTTKATPQDVADFLYEYCTEYGDDDEFKITENN